MSVLFQRFVLACLAVLATGCASARNTTLRQLAGQIAGSDNKSAPKTVAVFTPEFRGLSQESDALEIADLLTHEIVTGSGLKVVERSRLNQVLREHELIQAGAVDPAAAAKIGRLLSVDAVLIGTVTGKSETNEIFLRLVDSGTGVILKTAYGTVKRDTATIPAGKKNIPSEKPQPAAPPRGEKSAVKTTAAARRPAGKTSTPSTGLLEEGPEASGRLVDVAFRKGGAGGFAQVIGRIENSDTAMLPEPHLSLQLYDGGKNLIGGAPCLAPDRPVLQNERLPFSCLFKPPAGYAHFEISLEPASALYGHRALSLSAKNLKFGRAPGSVLNDYALSGVITNAEEQMVTYPKILISLFDASGKFIGSAYGFAVKKALKPGESSPFHVSVYGYALHGKPASYEAFYSALMTRTRD